MEEEHLGIEHNIEHSRLSLGDLTIAVTQVVCVWAIQKKVEEEDEDGK